MVRSTIDRAGTAVLAFALAVLLFFVFGIPPLSIGGIAEDCAQSSLWTSTDDAPQVSSPETISNVILVMLDGVRWQEIAESREDIATFPRLHSTLSKDAQLFINDSASNPFNKSLPAYQSIFAGSVQQCDGNNCGRISTETFPERLVRDLKLNRKKVATLASWNQIACAVESQPMATFVNAGNQPLIDGPADSELATNDRLQLQKQWASSYYRGVARFDEHTFHHAMSYLRRHRPNFLFLSFVDSDIYGHQHNYQGYAQALRQYDRWLNEIVEKLDTMGEYGEKTAVIVTTDHGRGSTAASWSEHGAAIPESGRIWTYVRLPQNGSFRIVERTTNHSHVDLRPTIETLFGLQPRVCSGCGKSFIAPVERDPTKIAAASTNLQR
jgi:hypothetical protein